jgi:glycosidase
MPFAYGVGQSVLRVIVRAPRGQVIGGKVCFNDRYAWEGNDYAPLGRTAPLWVYARDGELEYWAADLALHPPRLRYRFGLETSNGTRWYGWDGLRDEPLPNGAFEFAYIAEGDRPDSPEWARGATFYQIFPDRFARGARPHRTSNVDPWDAPVHGRSFLGGDLDGIVERLDHIASLSVDALYLTPIFTAPSNHKYDTADYFSVDPDFGGDLALRRLVEAVHARGMRLILDGVFNHTGSQWAPFQDVLANGAKSAHADWFYFATDQTYETWATNVPSLPKLRTGHPEVRELVCRIGRFWVEEFGIDGWRLDVASEVDHRTWRAFRQSVRDADPAAFLVGEVWHPAMPWLRGDEFDSVMNYPARTAIIDFAGAGEPDGQRFLDAIDRMRALYPEPIHHFLYNLLGSHDVQRPLTALGGDRAAFGMAPAMMFALPGSVSVYYGDEVGMEGGDDPGSRGGMIWDQARQDRRLLDLYRRLGAIRRRMPMLRVGGYSRLDSAGAPADTAAFARGDGTQRLVVVINGSARAGSVPRSLVREWAGSGAQVVETLDYAGGSASVGSRGLRLPPRSVVLLGDPVAGKPVAGDPVAGGR